MPEDNPVIARHRLAQLSVLPAHTDTRIAARIGGAQTGASAAAGTGQLVIGISGARRNATVAACSRGTLVAVCEQERLSRMRGVPLERGRLPVEAVEAVLRLAGERHPSEVHLYAVAEEAAVLPAELRVARVEHHKAHAASAFYTSPFERAAVLVCDRHSNPCTSVWVADGAGLQHVASVDAAGGGLAGLYSDCARVFGFGAGQEHRLEALARLDRGREADGFDRVRKGAAGSEGGLLALVAEWLAAQNGQEPLRHRAQVASAFQAYVGRRLLETVSDARASTGMRHLCVAGGLFYNTCFNTMIRQSGIFDDVFVAPNPGNAGLACGAALVAAEPLDRRAPLAVSPFLGPEYDPHEIKCTLENCKLSYDYGDERQVIAATVDALQRGQLVGWFQGRMEWGHRALGNRSILASPLSSYVLDNLNVFLKQRERHRTYGVSVPEADASVWFLGPPRARFMEFEYEVIDRERFRNLLPDGATTVRVQTIPEDDAAFRRYLLLHRAFGQATGVPVLVNTSFNGFSEPIVCSPRDAIRVFFGTGLDMLVLDRFIVRK